MSKGAKNILLQGEMHTRVHTASVKAEGRTELQAALQMHKRTKHLHTCYKL